MANRIVKKKSSIDYIDTNIINQNKNVKVKRSKLKTKFIGACIFVGIGLVGSFSQFIFIHNNENMKDSFLMSGIEPLPTIHPDTKEAGQLREENRKLRELVSRGESQRQLDAMQKRKVIGAINKHLGGMLKNKGEFIYEACQPNSKSATLANPILVAAKFKLETDNGTSDVLKYANNPSGINWNKERYSNYPIYSKWYVKFNTLEEGIEDSIYVLKRYYLDEGRTDIVSIGLKWAPPDDPRNGIGGMDNKSWADNVSDIYEEILKDAK